MVWWKNKRLRPALWFMIGLLFIALGRDILANGRPLFCRIQGSAHFPGLRAIWKNPNLPYGHPILDSIQQGFLWRQFEYESAIFAPVPFSPGELPVNPDTTLRRATPGTLHPTQSNRQFRHWLGTDVQGYDVAAGIISGARVAILTGSIAMSLAFGIGLIFGAIAGFWGDDRLYLRRGQLVLVILGLPFSWFYGKAIWHYMAIHGSGVGLLLLPLLGSLAVLGVFVLLGNIASRLPFFSRRILIPADLMIMRFAEVFTAVPGLIAIVAFAAMLQNQTQSMWALIALIGAFSWPGVAMFIRAELLRIRSLDYISAARGMGLSEWRILYRHALPNAMRPAYTIFAFGVAGAILLEAMLSFLGYGDNNLIGATWGSLLQNARSSPQLWWISLPPGLAICLTILSLHLIGEALSERR